MSEFVCLRLDYEKCDEVINEYLESIGSPKRLCDKPLIRKANWRLIEGLIILDTNITKELLIKNYLLYEKYFQYKDLLTWTKQNL